MRLSRRLPGATLVEVLVYSVLVILILAGVYASYRLARDYYSAAQVEIEAQQCALDAALGVSQELAHAAGDSLVVSESPPAILFLSAKTDTGPFLHDEATGQLLWQRWVLLYLDAGSQKIKRLERVLEAPIPELPEDTPGVQEMLVDSSLEHYVLGHNIIQFSPEITVRNTLRFQVRSSLEPNRLASGVAPRAYQDARTQIVLATEVPIRQ